MSGGSGLALTTLPAPISPIQSGIMKNPRRLPQTSSGVFKMVKIFFLGILTFVGLYICFLIPEAKDMAQSVKYHVRMGT